MIDKNNFKELIVYALIIVLFILAFIIIKPIILAIIYGFLLAYITHPVYRLLLKKIKNEFISAFIVCFGFFVIMIIILILVIGSLFTQAVNFYISIKDLDIASTITGSIPSFISSELSSSIIDNLRTSISSLILRFLDKFSSFILNLPVLLLNFAVTIFVFFFSLKDGKRAMDYLKTISPLKKETEEKFLKKFRDVTNSVLLGQVLIGIVQGSAAGIGYLIFGIPNALLLTILSIFASIIPLIGPSIIWIPVFLFLLISGRADTGFIFLVYNMLFTSLIDNLLRPLIVSKKTEINTAIVIIGMIGGFLVFGILGLIIGPLVLAYVLLVMEIYRKKTTDESIVFKEKE